MGTDRVRLGRAGSTGNRSAATTGTRHPEPDQAAAPPPPADVFDLFRRCFDAGAKRSGQADSAGWQSSPALAGTLLEEETLLGQVPGWAEHNTTPRLRFRDLDRADQRKALDSRLLAAAEAMIVRHWTPADLDAVFARRGVEVAGGHLLDLVALITDRQPALLVHQDWRAQLADLGAQVWWPGCKSPSAAWAERDRRSWDAAVQLLITLLAAVGPLGRLEQVLPKPGDPANARHSADASKVAASSMQRPGHGSSGVDAKALGRVRGLLAKAEATEFAEEAEALTAKAQQLMTQYSLEQAWADQGMADQGMADQGMADQGMADQGGPSRARPAVRRLWLENPYLNAKSMLVRAVATANNCRCVLLKKLGCVTLLGHEGDLRLVELLTTSLLVQANRAMTATGSQVSRRGQSTTRSYRQSFLVSYAERIGERLQESAESAQAAADDSHGGSLLPVLVARRQAVEDLTTELFPRLRAATVNVSNSAGWGAGRSAADRAQLDVRRAVGTRS